MQPSLHQLLGFPATESLCSSSFYPTMEHHKPEGRASQNHKEAERKRRHRINAHLHTLRDLLLCNSKIDKASLLAKVVERVRELKQQTTEMDPTSSFPSEWDEIAVLQKHDSVDGKSVIKASLCCEDRVDLLPDLIQTLKALPALTPLRSEIVTLGGRTRNVIVLAADKDRIDESARLLTDALNSLILRSTCSYISGGQTSKRRRMFQTN